MLIKDFAVDGDANDIVIIEICFEDDFKLSDFLGVEYDLIGEFTINIKSKFRNVTGGALAEKFVAIGGIVLARDTDAKNGVSIGQREGIAALVPDEEQAGSIPSAGSHGIDVAQIRTF